MVWLGDLALAYWHWWSIGAFLLAAAVESILPDGRTRADTLPRWLTSMGSYVGCISLSSVALPAFLLAVLMHRADDGPLRAFAAVDQAGGPWAVLVLGLLGIDFVGYWAHRLEHRVQLLWRFHAVHHADIDMDVSTTLLHHPVAYLVTSGLIGVTMIGLGLPAWVFPLYALFEVAGGAFQHLATPVPDRFERAVRWLLVTPGMHQAHHSDDPAHFNTNFGGVLSVWDRVFGSYLALDADARRQLRFGIGPTPGTALGQPGSREHEPYGVLTMPFRMRFSAGPAPRAASVEPSPAQPLRQS